MDKYEYRVKTEQMLDHMEKKQYKKAMEIADTIDWRRVKVHPCSTQSARSMSCAGKSRRAGTSCLWLSIGHRAAGRSSTGWAAPSSTSPLSGHHPSPQGQLQWARICEGIIRHVNEDGETATTWTSNTGRSGTNRSWLKDRCGPAHRSSFMSCTPWRLPT